jgi:DNA repair exonuclease SbcCD ATPase subunit
MSAIGEVRDQNYQNKLIIDYINRNYEGVDRDTLRNVRVVNKEVNNKIGDIKISRNIIWKPKTFEFSNMFSYGGNNKIDFKNMTGLYGIFAPNHTGKSAFLDAISFCCFDKCSRTKAGSSVLNNKKSKFYCKLNFQIDGVDYFIERKANKQKSGHVRVDVNFWMIGEDAQVVSLNGEQRKDTNANIRGYIGTYEDFELTCLSVQNDNTGFIDKSQSERKDSLAQFLDLDIFEELFQTANDDMKDVNALLKEFQKQDFATTLAESKNSLEHLSDKYSELKLEKDGFTKRRQKIEKLILDNTKRLHKIDSSIVDIKALKIDERQQVNSIKDLTSLSEEIKAKAAISYNKSKDEKAQLNKYNINKLTENLAELNSIKQKSELSEKAIISLKNKVELKMSKVKILEGLNPECEFCRNNDIIKDAQDVQSELIEDRKYAKKLFDDKKILNEKIKSHNGIEKTISNIESIKAGIIILNAEVSTLKDKHSIVKSKKALVSKTLIDTKDKIENYYNNINSIKENKATQNRIDKYSSDLADVKASIESLTDETTKYYGKINVEKNTISSIKKSLKNIKQLEAKYKAYEYYLDAVSRNGIPYELISLVMPMVQDEINNILSQIVDFGVIFEVDGKNINTYIRYDDDNIWGLELTSGMEKFIASLAIRSSLINISNLPRPTFIAIDEGFGNLDSDNLNSMFMFFNYLKSQFDFVFIISHLDVMRDIVDQLIEIKVQNGLSQIRY